MARVRLDRVDLRRVVRGATLRELRVEGPRVVNRAKILCPVDTGRLRASIQGEARRTWSLRPRFTVGTNVDYAPYVHDGTRPHVIRPRNASVLRFQVDGRTVYARVVNHPGTRARPFLDRALREVTSGRGYRITEG
jgi:hypothetical protein